MSANPRAVADLFTSMGDEPAFLELISRHGDEPLPRLIFADWLDDIGDPLSAHKAAFLRLWCRLLAIPLADLEGYADRAEQLEGLKPHLPDDWVRDVNGHCFRIATLSAASARAEAFLQRILHPDDYELYAPTPCLTGWVVSFSVRPVPEPPRTTGREKEHKRGGPRTARRAIIKPQHGRPQSYFAATPLLVERATGRVGWFSRPQGGPPRHS